MQVVDAETLSSGHLRLRAASGGGAAASRPGARMTVIKQTRRADRGVSEHKTSPDFDQKKCSQAKSKIMQALGVIDCDVFIEMDR